MNRQKELYKTTLAAMFAAIIYVVTTLISVPAPFVGNINLGDCFVILAGLLLGPVYGAAAAGIGSAFSDLSNPNYAIYAPATLIIKALMAIVVVLLYKAIKKTGFRYDFISVAISGLVAELIMVAGYFVYETFIYNIAAAIPNLLYNTCQGIVGLIAGAVLFSALNRVNLISKINKFK